jgi:hypothetical protein
MRRLREKMSEKGILEKLQEANMDAEIWWDSSPFGLSKLGKGCCRGCTHGEKCRRLAKKERR